MIQITRAMIVAVLWTAASPMLCQSANPAPPPAPNAQTPPVITETVPPAFDKYPLGPDSQTQPSVPAGKTFQFEFNDSKIFPNSRRTITVYVPAAYKAEKPACVFVVIDGLSYKLQTVFDNLIAQKAMPVTIGIGVSSGTVSAADSADNPRFDRSFEFDSLDDRLARFLEEEVIPEVEKHRTPDGDAIKLSTNPDDRAIGGGSTGGIAAFTVAWQRPDLFRRVFSSIGTFVGMRGGESFYVQVRKTEPKPLRVFFEDGVHDEWPGGPEMGDWWMSNQTMNRALEFAGYDVRHNWGAGTHNGTHAASIFPDAMRWLWRDWPAPLSAGAPGNPVLQAVLQPGETWKIAAEGCAAITHLNSDPKGQLFYGDRSVPTSGGTVAHCEQIGSTPAFAFGADGKQHVARVKGGLEVRTGTASTVRAAALSIRDLTVRNNGDVYATTETRTGTNELWLIPSKGQPKQMDKDLKGASGVALSPDGLWLFVAQERSHKGISYRVLPDGSLDSCEPFYDFYVPASADDSGAGSIAMDRDGRAYVATRMGVQVFDRNGRVTAILPLPGNETITGICFGGDDFKTLYVIGGGKIYQRRMRVAGAPAWAAPFKLPPWGAG